ncbi:MAG: metallophosphatase [Saprospiraceae bacterium]
MKRRDFIVRSTIAGFGLAAGKIPLRLLDDHDITRLTILHTNDVHSRIEPFPMDGSRNEGKGGVSRRATLIERVRKSENNVLLFDCGDIFQGTPYFNFFGGELEMKLMSKLGYDASTMGNHDFDAGIDGFYKQLPQANFPFLVANYDFSNTIMNGHVEPYKIFTKNGIKIGVFGIGIELEGLVPKSLYKETQYLDPIVVANRVSKQLRYEEKCDFIICLSHLGYKYRRDPDKVSDVILAKNTEEIDAILGGHTHTFMHKPDIQRNANGHEVVINQAGWAGLMLGRLDIYFEKNKKGKCVSCKNTYVM